MGLRLHRDAHMPYFRLQVVGSLSLRKFDSVNWGRLKVQSMIQLQQPYLLEVMPMMRREAKLTPLLGQKGAEALRQPSQLAE